MRKDTKLIGAQRFIDEEGVVLASVCIHVEKQARNESERSETVFGLLSLFSVLVCFNWFLFF